jgi:hypothetical protein
MLSGVIFSTAIGQVYSLMVLYSFPISHTSSTLLSIALTTFVAVHSLLRTHVLTRSGFLNNCVSVSGFNPLVFAVSVFHISKGTSTIGFAIAFHA